MQTGSADREALCSSTKGARILRGWTRGRLSVEPLASLSIFGFCLVPTATKQSKEKPCSSVPSLCLSQLLSHTSQRRGIHRNDSSLLGGSLFTPAAAHLRALGNALLPAPPDPFISPPIPARHARGQQVCKMHIDALHQQLLLGPWRNACCEECSKVNVF